MTFASTDLTLRRPPFGGEPQVLVVGSGKGGVGKSVLSVVLGQALAAEGHRVLLFDADQNLGNLHVVLGVRPVARRESLLQGAAEPAELVQPIGPNLWLLAGDSGAEGYDQLDALEKARLDHRLSMLYDRFDIVLADAGAGLDSVARTAALRASRLVVVTNPEPAALSDAYALIKLMHQRQPDLPVDVLVNRAFDDADGHAAFAKLAAASERFLRRGLRFLGAVPEDDHVRRAVRTPQRLLATLAGSAAARTIRETILPRLDLPSTARSAV